MDGGCAGSAGLGLLRHQVRAPPEFGNPGQGACYDWRASKNDPYSRGDAESFANGQWSICTDTGVPMDFAFKTFVDGKAPTVTKWTPTGKQVSPTAKPKVAFS